MAYGTISRPSRDEEREFIEKRNLKIVTLFKQGLSRPQIAARMGVSTGTVSQICKKYGGEINEKFARS
jgi:DNA-directed RNA polymerase specialized sigma subunit